MGIRFGRNIVPSGIASQQPDPWPSFWASSGESRGPVGSLPCTSTRTSPWTVLMKNSSRTITYVERARSNNAGCRSAPTSDC
jgi:hypothetical protein